MSLDEDVLTAINRFVRGGFLAPYRIVEIVGEELSKPGQGDRREITAAVQTAVATHEASKQSWPAETDCDRLQRAFRALNARGIIALENAGFTQSDGYELFREALSAEPDRERVVGYCFYHGQDVDHAIDGDGLHLAFGPRDPENEESEGPRIGAIVVEELERAELATTWSGDFKRRILLPRFDWKRR